MRLLAAACGVNGDGASGDGEEGSGVWDNCRERPGRRRMESWSGAGREDAWPRGRLGRDGELIFLGWGTDFSGLFMRVQAVEFSIRPLLLTVMKK
jgi:hypothetical protein